MKIKSTLAVILAAFVSSTVYADKDADFSHLPPRVQQTIREYKGEGEVKKVKTKRLDNGQTVYEVDYKERGDEKQILIGQDGFVIGGEQYVGKGRDKENKKDKDKDKDKKDKDRDRHVVTTPPTVAPAPIPAPGRNGRSERRENAAFQKQVAAINALDGDPVALQAGLAAIAKETGVPVKTLMAQKEKHEAGVAALLLANELAQITRKPAREFFAQRSGKGSWDDIAFNNGVNPDTLLPKLQRVHRVMAQAAEKK